MKITVNFTWKNDNKEYKIEMKKHWFSKPIVLNIKNLEIGEVNKVINFDSDVYSFRVLDDPNYDIKNCHVVDLNYQKYATVGGIETLAILNIEKY